MQCYFFALKKCNYDCFSILDVNRFRSHLTVGPGKNLLNHFNIKFATIIIILDHKVTFHDDTSCCSNGVKMLLKL